MNASSGSGECPIVKTSGARHMRERYLSDNRDATSPHCHLPYAPAFGSLEHMAKMAKTGLGKGLGALIGARPVPARADPGLGGEQIRQVGLTTIFPSPLQPRKNFEPDA